MGMKIPVVFFMPSALRGALWFLCALLLVSKGRADVLLYDTGTAPTDYSNTGGAVGKNGASLFSRGQSFTNTAQATTITSINVWLSATMSLTGTFNLSLFSSTGTPGSSATPDTQIVTTGPISAGGLGLTTAAQLISFNNLNWAIDGSVSTYFFVFDARNMASGSDNYFIWQNSVPAVSGQNSADSTNFSTWSHLSSTGAAQVYAVVPEPGTWMLLSLAFSMAGAVIGFRTVRRRLFFFTFSRGC
jgi:hypothetical protein